MDPYLPERAFNAHLNVGWWNHNEAGNMVYDVGNRQYAATKISTELQYAVGTVYPTSLFDYRLELNGISYINQPDEFVYSRENWMYVTPSIRYKFSSFFSLDLGIDIRLMGNEDETNTTLVPDKSNEDFNLPNYADWKVNMGLNLKILPFVSTSKSAAEIERQEFNERVEFFQDIVEKREQSQDIQEELEKLKEEREAAEKELEELRQIMEEEQK
ncbi:MAG: hypothetical protein GF313_06065 [Caldithrix sp.]|nr:hypothetical protein [Caldithrix sp.]